MRLSDFKTAAERDAYRAKRRDSQYTSERELDGAGIWLKVRWMARARLLAAASKPHLYY